MNDHKDRIPQVVPGELEAQRYASNRAWDALMLARTPEAWGLLLRGETVLADQLDQQALRRAKKRIAA